MTDLTFNDITWTYTLDKVLKDSSTGMISEIKYTYTGTYSSTGGPAGRIDHTSSIAFNKLRLAPSDPSAENFINITNVTIDDVCGWIDNTISEIPIFDIEAARAPGTLPNMAADDPRQPSMQDLSSFRFSSYKEQMQDNIRKTIQKKIQDAAASVIAEEEHTFNG
jgi:hypothetical protein